MMRLGLQSVNRYFRVTGLKTVPVRTQLLVRQRLSCSAVAASNLNVASKEKNVITSTRGDCFTHEMTAVQRFFERSALWPNKIAIECGITGRKYTYATLGVLIRRFGSCLRRMGFQKGDFMGIILPNIPEYPVALFGAAGIGMPVTLVNPAYGVEEIARQLQNCSPKVIVGVAALAEQMKQAAAQCPSVQKVILIGDGHQGFVNFKDMLQDEGDLFDDNIEIDVHIDTFVQPYSSGTTGLPKGVVLPHYGPNTNTQQILHPGTTRIQPATETHQDVLIAVLPFFHIYGLIAFLMVSFEAGAKVVALPRFQPDTYLNAVHNHHPTKLYVVPPLVAFLGSHPGLKLQSLDRLHSITNGAASLNKAVAEMALDRLKQYDVVLQEGFGMTETMLTQLTLPTGKPKFGSCGSLLSHNQAKIVDTKSGESLGANQTGELWVRGPQIMKGYFNNPEGTRETLQPDGWLRTGDIAYYDDDHDFFIVDRIKELIKVKGFQVSPTELEDLLCRHPAIMDAAVLGVPDQYDGEAPRAFVVKSPQYKSDLSEADIVKFVESRVAPHKRLTGGVVFVESIPKSTTGKIMRKEMKAKYL